MPAREAFGSASSSRVPYKPAPRAMKTIRCHGPLEHRASSGSGRKMLCLRASRPPSLILYPLPISLVPPNNGNMALFTWALLLVELPLLPQIWPNQRTGSFVSSATWDTAEQRRALKPSDLSQSLSVVSANSPELSSCWHPRLRTYPLRSTHRSCTPCSQCRYETSSRTLS